jgi:hypothetical protein
MRRRSPLRSSGRRGGPVRARSAATHSTDSHAEPWLSGRHDPLPEVYVSITPAKPQHCAVSAPAYRLRCRPTALAPPNRPLRKLPAAEGLRRAARRQARNPPGLRPLGHARPPRRTRRHLGAASHRARYADEADPDRTLAPVVHQIGVQTQGLPTVCCLCTTQINSTASPGRYPAAESRRRVDRTVTPAIPPAGQRFIAEAWERADRAGDGIARVNGVAAGGRDTADLERPSRRRAAASPEGRLDVTLPWHTFGEH